MRALVLGLLLLLPACSALGLITRGAMRQALEEEGFVDASGIVRRIDSRAGELSNAWWEDLLGVGITAALGGGLGAVGYVRARRGPSHRKIVPHLAQQVARVTAHQMGEGRGA